jgi:hypothetical protein
MDTLGWMCYLCPFQTEDLHDLNNHISSHLVSIE